MDGNEELMLNWSNHQPTLVHEVAALRHMDSFADVTLACENKLFKVHKFVLAMCSDYFRNIFASSLSNSNSNLIIILKDCTQKDLDRLLDFMYLGVIEVEKLDLPSLVKTAENLQIKGLAFPDGFKDEAAPSRGESNFDYQDRSSSNQLPRSAGSHVSTSVLNDSSRDDQRREWRPQDLQQKERLSPPAKRKRLDFVQTSDTFSNPNIPSSTESSNLVTTEEHNSVSPAAMNNPMKFSVPPCGEEVEVKQEHIEECEGEIRHKLQQSVSKERMEQLKEDVEAKNDGTVWTTESPSVLMGCVAGEDNNEECPEDADQGVLAWGEAQDKRYRCGWCGKNFRLSVHLKDHIRTHTGEKPYTCLVCSKNFTQRSNLRTHLSKIHNEQLAYVKTRRSRSGSTTSDVTSPVTSTLGMPAVVTKILPRMKHEGNNEMIDTVNPADIDIECNSVHEGSKIKKQRLSEASEHESTLVPYISKETLNLLYSESHFMEGSREDPPNVSLVSSSPLSPVPTPPDLLRTLLMKGGANPSLDKNKAYVSNPVSQLSSKLVTSPAYTSENINQVTAGLQNSPVSQTLGSSSKDAAKPLLVMDVQNKTPTLLKLPPNFKAHDTKGVPIASSESGESFMVIEASGIVPETVVSSSQQQPQQHNMELLLQAIDMKETSVPSNKVSQVIPLLAASNSQSPNVGLQMTGPRSTTSLQPGIIRPQNTPLIMQRTPNTLLSSTLLSPVYPPSHLLHSSVFISPHISSQATGIVCSQNERRMSTAHTSLVFTQTPVTTASIPSLSKSLTLSKPEPQGTKITYNKQIIGECSNIQHNGANGKQSVSSGGIIIPSNINYDKVLQPQMKQHTATYHQLTAPSHYHQQQHLPISTANSDGVALSLVKDTTHKLHGLKDTKN